MSADTPFQKDDRDDFQWAQESGYLGGALAAPPPAASPDGRQHQLMIFSGLHAGANMPLTAGTYAIGSSPDCDIVLRDPGIHPIHLTLTCHAGHIVLLPDGGTVYIDGQPAGGETVLPEPPVVVTIAGLHFGVAVDGAAWCPLGFPKISADTGGFAQPDPPPEGLAAVIARWKKAPAFLQKAGAPGKFALAALVLLFIGSTAFLFHTRTPGNQALIAGVEKQFSEWHLPPPAIRVDAGGVFDITAYVPTVARKETLTGFLQTLPAAVRPHIHVDDQIERALQDYVARMTFSVEAAYKGNGRAAVKGFVKNQQDADLMRSQLKSNVAGLDAVDFQVWPLDQVRAELEAVLRQAALTDKLDLRPESGHLLARGTLNAEEHARWQTAQKTILERLGGQLDIVDQTSNAELIEHAPGRIDIPIAGVTMHPFAFITLQDGKVYFKGASLKNGAVIKDIGPDRIIVQIDGRDYYYNY